MSKIDLLNIDCMEYMKNCKDNEFDLAIVDPPYRDENQPTKDMREKGSMTTITGRPNEKYFDELRRVSKNQIIWGANNFNYDFKGFIVWDKDLPFNFTMSMAEIASISDDLMTISKIYKLRIAGAENRIHPTQKPVKLYEWLLYNYAKPNYKIFDSHFGSGSIAIACHNLGFDLTACELDPEYYINAKKRLELHQRQLTLFNHKDNGTKAKYYTKNIEFRTT